MNVDTPDEATPEPPTKSATVQLDLQMSASFCATPGAHTLNARVDAEINRVVEESELNNSFPVDLELGPITIIKPGVQILKRLPFVGQFWAAGFKDCNYSIGYPSSEASVPTGNLFFRDLTVWWAAKWAQATSFDYLVIPPTGTGAWIRGSCTYCDTPGYTFSLYVEDNDNNMWGGSTDIFWIIIRDAAGSVVYQMNEHPSIGTVAIYRS